MQCYTELTPPTAVSHSITISLLGPRSTNLVVARTSLLQIFEIKSVASDPNASSSQSVDANDGDIKAEIVDKSYMATDLPFDQRITPSEKLILIAEYPLAGTILSLAKVKPLKTKSRGEALLVAFREAKFSLVEWDPLTHSLSTISIHFYEGEEHLYPWAGDHAQYLTFLTVDPNNRCAALKFGPRQLAILPFRQADEEGAADRTDADGDVEMKGARKEDRNAPKPERRLYHKSFVLPTTALDPSLTQPIHLAFLFEYREPTIAILSAARSPAASNLVERKDTLVYSVFTLDLEQKASTSILTVGGLPFDLVEIVPLTQPVGGALLLGANELVHIDQSGKTIALAVNESAKACSGFPMSDQSDVGLRLEGCTVTTLGDSSNILIILRTGGLVLLSFKLDGRSVSGMEVSLVPADRGGDFMSAQASCASTLGHGRLFVGSEDGDSLLLSYQSKGNELSRKRSVAEVDIDEDELNLDDDLEDEDDIYGGAATQASRKVTATETIDSTNVEFRLEDRLLNIAAAGEAAFGHVNRPTQKPKDETIVSDVPQMEMVIPSGRGYQAGLAVLRKDLDAQVLQTTKVPSMRAMWPITVNKSESEITDGDHKVNLKTGIASNVAHTSYMIASVGTDNGGEESFLYAVNGTGVEKLDDKEDFGTEVAATVAVGTMFKNTRIVQIHTTEIRVFNADFGLEQIIPVIEDELDGIKVVGANFCDPYVVIMKSDASLVVLEATASGELEEMDLSDAITEAKWTSACLYRSQPDTVLLFALSAEGVLKVFDIKDLAEPSFNSAGLSYLPSSFGSDFVVRRAAAKETLTEILVADIGDAISTAPYLIARTSNDDLAIYQLYQYPASPSEGHLTTNLRFLKISQPQLATYLDDPEFEAQTSGRQTTLHQITDTNGYSTVFQSGTSPSFILKEASTMPRVLRLRGKAVKSFAPFDTLSCDRGFVTLDADDNLNVCQLSPQCRYGDTGWMTKKIQTNGDVTSIVWHEIQNAYVIATSRNVDFKLPEDDYHHEWADESTTFLPQVEQSTLQLVDAATWTIVDSFELDYAEVITSLKTINVEVSEVTRQRKDVIVAGTALLRGEDLAARGNVYIFDVIAAVPHEHKPETNRKLKIIAREEVKGAVTAVSEIGSQGFFVIAQGQKCVVRGMKEDGSIPPVAFIDIGTHMTVARTLPGTGLTMFGDLIRGVQLVGYTEDPYRMIPLGRGPNNQQVVAGNLLPHNSRLDLVFLDEDTNLHVYSYDPEDPSSLAGQRLIHRSTLHTGHYPMSITLLPSSIQTPTTAEDITNGEDTMTDAATTADPGTNYTLLLATQTGVLSTLTPLPEATYRRLILVQAYLTSQLEHACALNPRAYRAIEHERFGSRGALDGALLMRFNELSSQRRAEVCNKVGVESWIIRGDLEMVAAGPLGL